MSATTGKFVWYDVMTSDTRAAANFYCSVLGWQARESGKPDGGYTVFSVGPTMVGGLMPIPDAARAAGVPPCWTGYIVVADVDADAARVTAAGGAIRRAPQDIPGFGRFAVAADPHGGVFILFRPDGEPPQTPPAPGTPGTVGWHELHAGDLDRDFAFYAGLFGWTRAEAVDMGAMGLYQTFATGGPAVGGMMTRMPQTPEPFWLYYFNVDALDAAMSRVTQGGGQIVNGPHQVPGGSWIAQCADPQGALFAIVAPQR